MTYGQSLTKQYYDCGIVATFAGYDGAGEFCHRITLLVVRESNEELQSEVKKQCDALEQFFVLMHKNMLRTGSEIRIAHNSVHTCLSEELPKSWK